MRFEFIIEQWPLQIQVVKYAVATCCASIPFYALKIGDQQFAYIMSNDADISGVRQFSNEYFKVGLITTLRAESIDPIRVSETLNTLSFIYKAEEDVYELGDEKMRLTNFSFIVDFCEGIDESAAFLQRPKVFKGKQEFGALRLSSSPVPFRSGNYAVQMQKASEVADTDELSELLEQPLLRNSSREAEEPANEAKKVSKFGNFGEYTTEASDGNSVSGDIGGMENFDLVHEILNNRKTDGIIRAGDLKRFK